jgi:hypothetical protein
VHVHAPPGAWHPTYTQSTCLYYFVMVMKLVCAVVVAAGRQACRNRRRVAGGAEAPQRHAPPAPQTGPRATATPAARTGASSRRAARDEADPVGQTDPRLPAPAEAALLPCTASAPTASPVPTIGRGQGCHRSPAMPSHAVAADH